MCLPVCDFSGGGLVMRPISLKFQSLCCICGLCAVADFIRSDTDPPNSVPYPVFGSGSMAVDTGDAFNLLWELLLHVLNTIKEVDVMRETGCDYYKYLKSQYE